MRMVAPVYYTAELVRKLPEDGKRYETVHGELLVTPAPKLWHQAVVRRLLVALDQYLVQYPYGEVLAAPADISWGPDTMVQPDVFVADREEVRTLEWDKVRTLLLVIEVLSPSTSRSDRFAKRRLYQEVGVPLYWIVDPDDRLVEMWTPETTFPVVERERAVWTPANTSEPFTLELAELFRPI